MSEALSSRLSQERVEKGAAWLDEHMPGWFDLIQVGRLELHSICRCVLGQIGLHKVNLDQPWAGDFYTVQNHCSEEDPSFVAEQLGFDADGDRVVSGDEIGAQYADLRKAWVDEIRWRQKAAE